MGLVATIKKAVGIAFKAAGDKVSTAVFFNKSNTFDFATNSVVDAGTTYELNKAILVSSKKSRSDDKVSSAPSTKATHNLIVEGSKINFSNYDKVQIGNRSFKILPEVQDYEFVAILLLVEE
jgi:hypothetical protein